MLVAKVVIKSVAMKKICIKRRSLFVTGSMEMKQPCTLFIQTFIEYLNLRLTSYLIMRLT